MQVEQASTRQRGVAVVVEGSVTLHCSGSLTVGVEAKIKADVKANDVIIAGIVEGNIIAARRLEIKTGARITGDVTCEVFVVESGASFNGRVTSGKRLVEVQATTGKRTERASAAI